MSSEPNTNEVQDATVDDLFKGKKPHTRVAYLIVDNDLAEQWAEAKEAADELRLYSNDEAGLKAARALIDELRPQVKAATRALRFKALGRKRYEDLVASKPATDLQRKHAKDNGIGEPAWDVDLFPPLLLSEAGIAPRMTLDQATALWVSEDYNSGELQLLLNTALLANGGSKVLSLGKEYERTQS